MTSSTGTFTYWSLLGLSPDSDPDQLKKAFRKEAMRWHPDVNANDRNAEERFKWVNEAYRVLSDPQSRFEWEVAGEPTVEIRKIDDLLERNASQRKNDKKKPARKYHDKESQPFEDKFHGPRSTKPSHGFSSADKLLLLTVAIMTMAAINWLVF